MTSAPSSSFRLWLLFAAAAVTSLRATDISSGDLEDRVPTSQLRLNQIQVVGTHNSYHLEPFPEVSAVGKSSALVHALPSALSAASEYSHRPLTEQLTRQHIRQLELDLYPDPAGGRFREPIGKSLALLRGGTLPPEANDANGVLSALGLKVLHKPEFDYRSNAPTFLAALNELHAWSRKNPRHVPVLVILELKVSSAAPPDASALSDPRERALVTSQQPMSDWDDEQLSNVEKEITSVFAPHEILTPAEVRGDAPTLRDAVLISGWPPLDAVRGRVMFALDNENAVRDRYLALSQNSPTRLLFVSVPADHPEAAWMKINDPIRDFVLIQKMVRAGFLVRTRADEELLQAKANDSTRRECAFASGAQFISTDFPEPDLRYSDYRVQLPGNVSAVLNPIATPTHPSSPSVASPELPR